MAGEAERLAGLLKELESDRGYASGRRTFPRTLDPADATTITARLGDAVDEGVDTRGRKAAADGVHIACAPGCAACCEQLVMVWLPEALRVFELLSQPENATARERFLAAYPAWREAMGSAPAEVADLTARGKVAEHTQALLAAWRKRVVCAFNHEGLCGVYAARPNICRAHHALDDAERCRGDSPVPARSLAFEPLDRFLKRAGSVNAAMHHALGGPRQKTVALCEAVYGLLTSR